MGINWSLGVTGFGWTNEHSEDRKEEDCCEAAEGKAGDPREERGRKDHSCKGEDHPQHEVVEEQCPSWQLGLVTFLEE